MRRVKRLKTIQRHGYTLASGNHTTAVEITIKVDTHGLMRDEVDELMAQATDQTMQMMAGLKFVGGALYRIKVI